MKRNFWLPLAFIAALGIGIFIGNRVLAPRSSHKGQDKLIDVINLIQQKYVDELSMDSLVEMAIPALLQNLDPHTVYIPAADYAEVSSELESKFSGIGISFQTMNDSIGVVEVISGGPSEKAGVLPGDRIIAVDGESIIGKDISDEDVRNMLRGEKGTMVTITVIRSSSPQPLTFEIIRDDIPMESVDAAYMLEPGIGYVRISRFARNTYAEFFQAVNKLRIEGAENLVLDLRSNGGGYMEPSVLMANEFLAPQQLIVSTRGRDERANDAILSDGSGAFQEFGLVVLINELSASASEIFSGAIQDNDRGWILGRRSFGKGLVQNPFLLPDSSEVRLTVQRYYTPSGRSIQKEYTLGGKSDYDSELVQRFYNGETLSADSIKLKTEDWYLTAGGRTVYGGGGIMPDVFVPEDTTKITSYYMKVFNQGLLRKFAFEYCDLNRAQLQGVTTVPELLKQLPSDDVLLNSFVHYASINGVPARWYYINISSPLIVNQIKALIARDLLGVSAYYQVVNSQDNLIQEAAKYAKKPLISDNDSINPQS